MKSDDLDDHLPAARQARGGAPSAEPRRPAKGPAPTRNRWGERLLFTCIGLLLGFSGAWVTLEKAGPGPQSAVAVDPHAGIPGFGGTGGEAQGGTPAVDPGARQRLAQMQEAAKATPDNYDILVQLGNAAYDASESKVAIDAYEKALAKKDGDPNVLTDLGVSYRNTGELDKALACFDRALKADKDHWQARYNQVVVYAFDKKDKPKAAAILAELRQAHPEIPALATLAKELGLP